VSKDKEDARRYRWLREQLAESNITEIFGMDLCAYQRIPGKLGRLRWKNLDTVDNAVDTAMRSNHAPRTPA
jgi:hypothetical protein